MMPSRRNSTTEPQSTPLYAIVRSGGHKEHTGLLVAVQDSVATIDFKRESTPFFPVAQEIAVSFRSLEMQRPFDARGRVLLREDDESRLRYKLRFHEQDAQMIRMLFKRRNAPRAVPESTLSIEVRDAEQANAATLDARLRDISTQGLAFFVDPTSEMQLCSAHRLRVRIQLPGVDAALDLITDVRYRRVVDEHVQIGAVINWNAIRQPQRVRDHIASYVQRRKNEVAEQMSGYHSEVEKR
jgi:hypothetical protein